MTAKSRVSRPLTLGSARGSLFVLWFTMSFLVLSVFFLQTIGGKFDGRDGEAWGWMIPHIAPSLGLMITFFISNISGSQDDGRNVKPTLYWIAMGVSFAYLGSLLLLVLGEAFIEPTWFELYGQSSVYLGFFQATTLSILGAFFGAGGFERAPDSNGNPRNSRAGAHGVAAE